MNIVDSAIAKIRNKTTKDVADSVQELLQELINVGFVVTKSMGNLRDLAVSFTVRRPERMNNPQNLLVITICSNGTNVKGEPDSSLLFRTESGKKFGVISNNHIVDWDSQAGEILTQISTFLTNFLVEYDYMWYDSYVSMKKRK